MEISDGACTRKHIFKALVCQNLVRLAVRGLCCPIAQDAAFLPRANWAGLQRGLWVSLFLTKSVCFSSFFLSAFNCFFKTTLWSILNGHLMRQYSVRAKNTDSGAHDKALHLEATSSWANSEPLCVSALSSVKQG